MENEGVKEITMGSIMKRLGTILKNTPPLGLLLSVIYLACVSILKWKLDPPVDAAWFLAGGIAGIYFLDFADEFFRLHPSPFRTILFAGLFALLSLFIVTSSQSYAAIGLVLATYLMFLYLLVIEWKKSGTIDRWCRMIGGPVPRSIQTQMLIGFFILFLIETYVFLRSHL
ncbi:MAG: hypothetical protein Q7S76_03850 [bacterium]|nr:hypothetical protein [bacterium]